MTAAPRIPILKVAHALLATIPGNADDLTLETLQTDLLERLRKTGARGVLLDVSALDVVDSFIARSLNETGQMARLMNAEVVVVGVQPAVAMTLVDLGLKLSGVRTALNAEHGLRLLGVQSDRIEGAGGQGGAR